MKTEPKSDCVFLGPVDMTLRASGSRTADGNIPGPYTVKAKGSVFHVVGSNIFFIASCTRREDADRIAYCLRIVEESEESDRRTAS